MKTQKARRQGDTASSRLGRHLFILRRATWVGGVRSADVVRAFGVSRITAVMDLKDAVAYWTVPGPDGKPIAALRKEHGKVQPASSQIVHPEAEPEIILNLLANNATPCVTGLFETEKFLSMPKRTWLTACQPDSLAAILKAIVAVKCLKKTSLRMEYVGMKLDDKFRERWVCPIELQIDGPIARLLAVDLNDEEHPTKSFVLTRIRNARISNEPFPKKFQFMPLHLPESECFQIQFDPRLTPDQKAVMTAELNINNENIWTISKNDSFVRRRIYTSNQPAQESDTKTIWPPIIFCNKV